MNRTISLIFIVYFLAAWFSVGHLQADEYYQILEFAAYKLQLSHPNHLPWEFHDQIRPAIQAFFVVTLHQGLQWLFGEHGANPFTIAFITRLLAMTLSLSAAFLFYWQFKDELKNETWKRWMLFLSFFSYLVLFNSVRYSSENISSKLFVIGFCCILMIKTTHYRRYYQYFFYGLLLGFSFIVRYQIGFMIFGFMMWLLCIKKLDINCWILLAIGITCSFLIGITVDHWFYGDWVLTAWKYFQTNILQHRAAAFGTSPWYYYAGIAQYIPYGIVYVICTPLFLFYFRRHVITWVIAPFLVAHLLIGHKELRFMTPLLPFMPLVVMLCWQRWKNKGYFESSRWLWLIRSAWVLNAIALLLVMFTPAQSLTIYKWIREKQLNHTVFYVIKNHSNENCSIPNSFSLDFYLRKDSSGRCVNDLSDVRCDFATHCLVALNCEQVKWYKNELKNKRLVVSRCPAWIDKLNVGHWQSRTKAVENIYEFND